MTSLTLCKCSLDNHDGGMKTYQVRGDHLDSALLRLQMVSDRDKAVRAAALALLQTLYQLAGPSQTWGLLGKLTGQQHSLIEERFKHRDKGSSAPSAQPKSPSAAEPTAAWVPLASDILLRGRCAPVLWNC